MTRRSKGTGGGKKPRLAFPKVLKAPLPPFAASEGASPFAVALTHATQDQVDRAAEITGPYSPKTFAGYYEATLNPVWPLMSVALAETAAEIPQLVFKQLHADAKKVFNELIKQATLLDTVQIVEGAEVEEGILRRKAHAPPPPDLLQILGWSQHGRNHLQSAAKDLRAISMAVAAQKLKENGHSLGDAHTILAKLNGRTSPEGGASTAQVKQMVVKGRKLIAAAREAAKRP